MERNIFRKHATWCLSAFAVSLVFISSLHAQVVVDDIKAPLLKKLVAQAQLEASQAFVAPEQLDNSQLQNMSYDTYKAIRFNAKKSIWHGQRDFEIQLFHPGFLYTMPVNIHRVDWKNAVSDVTFDSSRFIYEKNAVNIPQYINSDIGHAGFRVHYPINQSAYKDEFAVFQGATYFRLIGQDQLYGLSARALAIDTGLPEGEEFPYFTDFWIIETDKANFTAYAKLNSPSVTGIFKFIITPGKSSVANVEAWIFAREDIQKLGLAPFTSMFLYGENSLNKPDDFRPEVHDSDGLAMRLKNGEVVWRPLDNPDRLRFSSLFADEVKGFGMLQRDIQYENYLDAEANYHLRPGLWVNAQKGFNKGRLELVELPTNSETHDNIVAYWVNEDGLSAGQSLHVKYQLQTTSGEYKKDPLLNVIRTLQGDVVLPGEDAGEDNLSRRFVVDFRLPKGADIDISELVVDVSATNAQIQQANVILSNFDSELRATFIVTPQESESVVDMRLQLRNKDQALSEVWTYVYE